MQTIYYNGKVYTGELPLKEAFVVEDERFTFVGSNEEVGSMADPDDEFVDLEGAFVCAGVNDSHMHLLGFGHALYMARLNEHTQSLSEMLDYLREYASHITLGEHSWIVGRGWNQDYFSDVDRLPSRWDLDQVSEQYPICITRACGHCLVVNSRALELLGVTAESEQPAGGAIGMENGQPDGRFYDNAMDQVYNASPAPSRRELKEMLREACRVMNTYGLTSCQTDDYCAFLNVDWREINAAYAELEAEGDMTVRVYEQANFTNVPALKEFIAEGNHTGVRRGRFTIGPLKMLGDGALGARTALLSRPYADAPDVTGLPVFTQETLDAMISCANAADMQVAVHAIGDGCLDRVLSAYRKALAEHPRADHRHGIVHCQITRPDQLDAIAELGLHVYAQSIFLDYDTHIVYQRVGEELAATSYNWKTLMDKGVWVSNGSDCPVELPDVMGGIQCAVTRQPKDGSVAPYLPDQAFTVQEALDSFTSRAAHASFEEKVKGLIAPGMMADFVVLGADPFETDVHALKDIPVVSTWLAGELVYTSK